MTSSGISAASDTEHSEEHTSDILVNFMKHSSTWLLSWPSAARQDKCWVPYLHIICLVTAPELQVHSVRFYKVRLEDQMQSSGKAAWIFVIFVKLFAGYIIL